MFLFSSNGVILNVWWLFSGLWSKNKAFISNFREVLQQVLFKSTTEPPDGVTLECGRVGGRFLSIKRDVIESVYSEMWLWINLTLSLENRLPYKGHTFLRQVFWNQPPFVETFLDKTSLIFGGQFTANETLICVFIASTIKLYSRALLIYFVSPRKPVWRHKRRLTMCSCGCYLFLFEGIEGQTTRRCSLIAKAPKTSFLWERYTHITLTKVLVYSVQRFKPYVSELLYTCSLHCHHNFRLYRINWSIIDTFLMHGSVFEALRGCIQSPAEMTLLTTYPHIRSMVLETPKE